MSLRNFFLIIFLLINIPLSIISFIEYQGQPLYYISFTIISFIFLIYLTNNRSIFLDNFISVFFFLGYWFSFSLKISLYKSDYRRYSDGVGFFDFQSKSYDEVLLVCIVSFISIMFASFIRRIFFPKFEIKNTNEILRTSKKEIKFSLFLILIVLIISSLNLYFEIYQRGMNYSGEINFILSNFIKWMLLIGMVASFSYILFNFLQNNYFPKYLISITIISKFVLSLSMLSRAMIFDLSSILWALFKFEKNKTRLVYISIFFIIAMILFFISLTSVSKIRHNIFVKKDNIENRIHNANSPDEPQVYNIANETYERNINKEKRNLFRFYERILVSRLHGFEAVMSVVGVSNKNTNLLMQALKEKPNNGTSFFDKLKGDLRERVTSYQSSITLPGIIAFLYYSGSLSILFLCLFFIFIFFSIFEIIIFKITNSNYILVSLFSQIIAYRLWHFGYAPSNSYKLLFGILLFVMIVYFINKYKDLSKSFYN